LILSAIFISPIIAYSTVETISVNITDKERIIVDYGNSIRSIYLVFTKSETFQNTDTIWYWKWDASDIQGQLNAGNNYKVRVYGFRIPFLSWYRNIIEIQKTNPQISR